MQKPRGIYSEGPADYRLPATLTREIGRIIVRWAFFEYSIQALIWELAGVTAAVGRLAVREPRVTDRLALLRKLAELRGIVIDSAIYAQLASSTRAVSEKRDLLAHGTWRRTSKGWAVQLTRGSYPFLSDDHDENRRIAPEAMHADESGLRSITSGIEKLIDAVRAIKHALPAELPPLRDKRPPRSSSQNRARDRSASKHPSPPRSSRA
jgi:hypothetical protein